MAASEPTVLEVTTMPQGYEVCLRRPGEPFMPVRQYLELRVSHAAVKEFCSQIALNIEQENAGHRAPFGKMCHALMNELFSEIADPRIRELREAIRTLDSPLLIVTNDHTVYWELLRDGPAEDDHVGMRLDVGRSLKTKSVPRSIPRSETRLRCLLIADPNSDETDWELPEAAAEARTLRDWLEARQVDCSDMLLGADAGVGAVFDRLAASTFDIIHYAGHVVLDPASGEYALRLYGGRLFPASSIRKQVRGSPMVFLAACRSSSTSGATTSATGSVESLTNAFLEAGAQLVVGSLFKVPEVGSRMFAEKFYECVLAGQPVGSSMRQARMHARGQDACGAAWASFVLYGDPCLKVEVRSDRLGRALQDIGLGRDRFDVGCLRVVERAFEYGGNSGLVASPHLFAALVAGDENHLKDRLEEFGVSPEALLGAFKQFFTHVGSESGEADDTKFSPNVAAIFGRAAESVRATDRSRIGELDLVEAFAKLGGGGVGEILKRLDVDVEALAPSVAVLGPRRRGREGTAAHAFGPVGRGACTANAWQVLADASYLAACGKPSILSTTHLLLAMLRDPAGPLGRGLRRFGIDPVRLRVPLWNALKIDPDSDWQPAGGDAYAVQVSPNVEALLSRATSTTKGGGRDALDVTDLLRALVDLPTRDVTALALLSSLLRAEPGVLLSGLFDEGGLLRPDSVDEGIQRALKCAMRCAQEKGLPALQRIHLLYGVLADEAGLFPDLLRRVGSDPAALADLLYVTFEKRQLTGDVIAALSTMSVSPGVLGILRGAEIRAIAEGSTRISETDLARELLVAPGPAAGQFLVGQGLNLQRLRDMLNSRPDHQLH